MLKRKLITYQSTSMKYLLNEEQRFAFSSLKCKRCIMIAMVPYMHTNETTTLFHIIHCYNSNNSTLHGTFSIRSGQGQPLAPLPLGPTVVPFV